MTKRYSIFSLARNAMTGHRDWPRAWRSPEPKKRYDVVIIGAGGHGLATAFYLGKLHGITNVAVIERGWLGGGNMGRNTTIVRSNYLWDESAALYEHALKLWESMNEDLNYNVMFSQRGVLNLAHNQHDLREVHRRVHANRLNGIDSEFLDAEGVKAYCPIIDLRGNGRHPVLGASLQRRAGTARHDAVAWGYARACDAMGMDIIQECPVNGFRIEEGRVKAVETPKGTIEAGKVGIVVSGNSTVLADMAGFRLPVQSQPLQALVSEPVKPVIDCVVMSGTVHAYVSQSDKGELVIGAGADKYIGYGQRGSLPITEETLAAVCELYPIFRRMRMMRQWAGVVDICPDASPVISKTPVENMFINCGWGTGGFKATPGSGWVFAHTIAKGEPHEINAPFSLDRFRTGYLIDEHGAAAVAH
ncbi:sarcosine oxidase subunit beta family protein [Fodinicurvata halophila]|uniref:Sarcosine oxidase subunit beta n=1 Tax=Fodinicurvata halophila TaxID=1419723 RepID=A0ABV8UPH3_9PROT